MTRHLRLPADARFRTMVGVGGVGGGMFLALEGGHTLGREESRGAHLLDARDACKLHIVAHHVAVLLAADPSGTPFHVVPLADVGDDDPGRWALAAMGSAGIDTTFVRTLPGRPTLFSVCFVYPDGSGGNITTLDSAAAALTEVDVDRLAPLLAAEGPRAIALAAPEVGLAPRRHLLELAGVHGCFRAASFVTGEVAAARDAGLFALADLLALNAEEAEVLAGMPLDPADPGPFLREVTTSTRAASAPQLLVTAGALGAFAFEGDRWAHRAAVPVEVAGAAGAGDALLGGVLAGLAAGVPLLAPPGSDPDALTCALDLGVLLAAVSVTSPHTIDPDADLEAVEALAAARGLAFAAPLADVL